MTTPSAGTSTSSIEGSVTKGDADPGDLLRAGGWRQGCAIVGTEQAEALALDGDLFLLVSQDCDIVRSSEVEPDIEFVGGSFADRPNGQLTFGKNPRRLQLTLPSGDETDARLVELDIRKRAIVAKSAVADLRPSDSLRCAGEPLRVVTRWLAKRYSRPAFPDEFNRRLQSVYGRIDRLSKKASGRDISSILIALSPRDEDLPDGEDYELVVWLTVPDDARNDGTRFAEASAFQERFEEILTDCNGIQVREVELRCHSDVTLRDLEDLSRLDFDHRSFAPKPGGKLPTEAK